MLALEWIKRNVASFHGDPNRMVAMGLGSGASMLSMSILRNNYFSKAILLGLSPKSIISINTKAKSQKYQQALAGSLGCDADPAETRLRCLRTATQEALLKASVSNALYQLRFVPRESKKKLTAEAITGMQMIIGDSMDIGDTLFDEYISPLAESKNASTTFDLAGAAVMFIKGYEKNPLKPVEKLVEKKFPTNSSVKDFLKAVLFCASKKLAGEVHSLNGTAYHFLLTKSLQLFEPALSMTDVAKFANIG
ncbi:unnamed protein product [Ixodes hexagonus]